MTKKAYSIVYEAILERERERLHKSMNDIQGNSATGFFLNLFAPSGFGKTAFLAQIWSDYEQLLPVSLVKVSEFRRDEKSINLRELLIHIIRDYEERLPRRVATPTSTQTESMSENELTSVLLTLVSATKEYEKVALLLVDDYDLIPEEQRRWFQEHVLSPATRTKKMVALLTSKTELRFTESFDLRLLLECRELTALDRQAMLSVLPQYNRIINELYAITGGLPSLIEKFVELLENSGAQASVDIQVHLQDLTERYYGIYVDQLFLGDLPSNIRETILVLSLLRSFDVKVLKTILPDLLTDLYQNYGTADYRYLDLIDRLRPWVEWRRQGGFAVKSAFRMMLQGYVFVKRPELFRKANRAAINLYHDWLRVSYRQRDLVELAYHIVALHRVDLVGDRLQENEDSTRESVEQVLLDYSIHNKSAYLDSMDLKKLRDQLEQDSDLNKYISEGFENTIDRVIDQRSKKYEKRNGNATLGAMAAL